MSSQNSTVQSRYSQDVEPLSVDQIRQTVQTRMIDAIRTSGARSFEFQTLKLEYRNLETGVRLGLL